VVLEGAYIGKRCKDEGAVVAHSVCGKRTVGVRAGWLLVGCYTLRGRCVCVFDVKSGDLCGSESVVAQGADWHSDAGTE
jgi:hypothetical protein